MIEEQITDYIMAKTRKVYPSLDPDEIVVLVTTGTAEYGDNGNPDIVCKERLQYQVVISTEKPIDRLAFLRAFRRGGVDEFLPVEVWQEYKRFERHNYIEASKLKIVYFFVEYTYEVTEA